MLRTTNTDEIDQLVFIPKHVGKRIKRECKSYGQEYDSLFVEYTQDKDIVVGFKRAGTQYIFHVDSNYPFTAPTGVIINGINYNSFFRLPSTRFETILRYISGTECFCCNSLMCKDNWRPIITLDKVIKQLEEYKIIKYNIHLKILADQIKKKYLVRDINLDPWLFNVSVPSLCLPDRRYH